MSCLLLSCLSYQLPDALARGSAQPYTAMVIVPTGIGAAIGGYAGDALPVARAFTAVADRVITHPNVMNGAQLYWPAPELLYVEGYALDQFAAGRTGLRPVTSQRVGQAGRWRPLGGAHESSARPPWTDPPGAAGPLYALKRRARAAQAYVRGYGAHPRPSARQRLSLSHAHHAGWTAARLSHRARAAAAPPAGQG